MKLSIRSLVLSCSLLSAAWFGAESAHAQTPESGVKVQVNDSIIPFPDAQPYIDNNNRLLVPVRFVSEKMGLPVNWTMKDETVSVSISNAAHSLDMKTGQSTITVDGRSSSDYGAAVFENGRVYVPLRVIFETFGVQLQWDNNNRIAILDADGKYHGPAWYAPPAQETLRQTLSTQVLQTANTYIGVPYVWGGTTPGGFDCSGLVQYVFQHFNISLPRTSLEMYTSAGQSVNDPQPGDLVFFARGGVTNHVGIYVGDGQFLSATNHGVKIDSLYSSYWGPKYIGAKRVL